MVCVLHRQAQFLAQHNVWTRGTRSTPTRKNTLRSCHANGRGPSKGPVPVQTPPRSWSLTLWAAFHQTCNHFDSFCIRELLCVENSSLVFSPSSCISIITSTLHNLPTSPSALSPTTKPLTRDSTLRQNPRLISGTETAPTKTRLLTTRKKYTEERKKIIKRHRNKKHDHASLGAVTLLAGHAVVAATMMDSSPQSKNPEPTLPMAGTKRPAPSLLPAFEPLSSSPGFPRPSKRQARPGSVGGNSAYLKYPTPIPTSSTGILSSSPPRVHQRPGALSRALSSASERTPLGAVASIELNDNGETLLMGRSSNSSHYQLSANRLVSRVHVKARFVPAPSALEPNKIEILCNGWNGLKLHCQGRTWELLKGDSFTSETEGTEIMLDVQDARVMIQWPKRDQRDRLGSPESQWDDSPPRPNARAAAAAANLLQSSPLRRTSRIESPDSPTPAHMTSSQRLQALLPTDDGEVHIYEDSSADEPELPKLTDSGVNVGQSFATEVTNSFSSELSEPEDENDPDEENDPSSTHSVLLELTFPTAWPLSWPLHPSTLLPNTHSCLLSGMTPTPPAPSRHRPSRRSSRRKRRK